MATVTDKTARELLLEAAGIELEDSLSDSMPYIKLVMEVAESMGLEFPKDGDKACKLVDNFIRGLKEGRVVFDPAYYDERGDER